LAAARGPLSRSISSADVERSNDITHLSVHCAWAYPDCLQNALSDISKRGAPPSAFEDYRPAVAKFPGFNHEEVLSKSQPMTKFSKLTEETVKAFVAESQTLVLSWKRSVEAAGT
jgi:hypothetical protein